MAKRRAHKRFMADINVVPYIDVMLVLLVIFMVTVPLLQQGVEVDLPKEAAAEMMPTEERRPVILTVDTQGIYYLNVAENPRQPLEPGQVFRQVQTALEGDPNLPVLIRVDRRADYGTAVRAMLLLKNAGANKVGLLTDSSETP